MLQDFNSCKTEITFKSDICIIGAGAAGITLARRLVNTGLEILLLESGGADYEEDIQELYKGTQEGEPYYDLDESRLRFFGGTTAIWGGRTAQLDSIDFTKRSWVDHSGWPVKKEDIAPYYIQAQKALELDTISDNILPGHETPFSQGKLTTSFWQFDEKFSRFKLSSCKDLLEAKNIKILTHASLTSLKTSENGREITDAKIANLNGGCGTINSRHYILATGGIENPRLLLSSRMKAYPQGIGNNNDQVGRYFMEHPHSRGGRICSENPEKLFRLFPSFLRQKNQRYGLLIRPTEDLQRDKEILNSGMTFGVFRHPGDTPEAYRAVYDKIKHNTNPSAGGRFLWRNVKRLSRWAQDRLGPKIRSRTLRNPRYGIYTVMRAEQAPNAESRIVLDDASYDALGMPRPKLIWKFQDIDKYSVREMMRALDDELRSLDLGSARASEWLSDPSRPWQFDKTVSSHDKGGYHHMGTTRMGDDPKTSVVDSQCRVHGINNLYVAGSSVFPTGGWANPTLTILALSMRLSDLLEHKHI